MSTDTNGPEVTIDAEKWARRWLKAEQAFWVIVAVVFVFVGIPALLFAGGVFMHAVLLYAFDIGWAWWVSVLGFVVVELALLGAIITSHAAHAIDRQNKRPPEQ